MKAQIVLARLFAVLVVGLAATQAAAQENVVPTKGYVPDAATAEAIARAVLISIYGQKRITAEEPLHAWRGWRFMGCSR